ncbi:MAG: hypothetical protein K2J42_09850 [Muribaculaceae bacterium]|nr:hypothetical protein [Muribaculaceae bacterium]
MKRKLLKQISKEWQSNLWLVVELIIVGAAMAGILTLLVSTLGVRFQPAGYEVTDAYEVSLRYINQSSPDYTQYEDKSKYDDDVYTLMERIRQLPEVEHLAYGQNALPFNYNFNGSSYISILDEDTLKLGSLNRRVMSPEYPIILNMHGLRGETPEQLSKMLENGEILVTSTLWNNDRELTGDDAGRYVQKSKKDSVLYRIGAVIPGFKRVDFEQPGPAIIMSPASRRMKLRNVSSFVVKLKPGSAESFEKAIKDNPDRWAIDNTYITEVTPVDRIRSIANRENNQQIAGTVVCSLFLLLSIFLGLLGTFWFRTGQRTVEIAIRLVNGATRRQIFARLMTEGIILWLCSLPFISAIMIMIYKYDLMASFVYIEVKKSMIMSTCITAAALLLMILVGILFPAVRAMKTDPAIALKDE